MHISIKEDSNKIYFIIFQVLWGFLHIFEFIQIHEIIKEIGKADRTRRGAKEGGRGAAGLGEEPGRGGNGRRARMQQRETGETETPTGRPGATVTGSAVKTV
jgi:hypothetical protein